MSGKHPVVKGKDMHPERKLTKKLGLKAEQISELIIAWLPWSVFFF